MSKLGPALIVECGGTGLKSARRITTILEALGHDPLRGQVRQIVLDVPIPQDLRVPSVAMAGAPYDRAVKSAKNGARSIFAGYDWLKHRPIPDPSVGTLAQGAGMDQFAGRFAFAFNAARYHALLTEQLHNLMAIPEIAEGLAIIIVSSLAGGAGSSMFLDAAFIARQVLEEMNPTQLVNTRFYGILLGYQTFLPVTQLHDSLRANTGATVELLDALKRGDLAETEIIYTQQGRTVTQIELTGLPFNTIFMLDHTRDGTHHIGNPEALGATCGDVALLLCHRGVNQTLAEMLRNLEVRPGYSRIVRIGYDLQISLAEAMRQWLALQLAHDIAMATGQSSMTTTDWLDRVYTDTLGVIPDATPKWRFRDIKAIRQLLETDGSPETATEIRWLLHGYNGSPGLIDKVKAQAAGMVNTTVMSIQGLGDQLLIDINASQTPIALRAWLPIVLELQKIVGQAQQRVKETREAVLAQRRRNDRKLGPNETWTQRKATELDAAVASRIPVKYGDRILKAAAAYVDAVQLDTKREIEDLAYHRTAQALSNLAEALVQAQRHVQAKIAELEGFAAEFRQQAGQVWGQMVALDQATELTSVVGLRQSPQIYRHHRQQLLAHALPNLQGTDRRVIWQQAKDSVAAVAPELPKLGVNGAKPQPLWAVEPTAQQTNTHLFRFRLNANGAAPEKVEGITDIPSGDGFAAAITLQAGHIWSDFAGLRQARFEAQREDLRHPLHEHALMLNRAKAE